MTTLQDLIEKCGITAHVTEGASPAYAAQWPNRRLYTVVLSYREDGETYSLTTYFHTQAGDDLRGLSVHAFLAVILDDASNFEQNSYEAWCDEMGYDPQNEEEDALYRDQYAQCEELLEKVQAFLGEHYNEFVYGIEG